MRVHSAPLAAPSSPRRGVMLVMARAPACALSRSAATLRPRRVACGAAAQLRAQRLKSGLVLAASRRTASAAGPPLDLTEENVEQVLLDARSELGQMFDEQMGMTGARRAARRATVWSQAADCVRRRHVHAG